MRRGPAGVPWRLASPSRTGPGADAIEQESGGRPPDLAIVAADPRQFRRHCRGDVLDVDLPSARHWRSGTDVPVGVPGSPGGLTVLAVDHHTDVEADWDVVRDHLLRILEGLDVDPVIADELVTLPGADEVHALLTLALAVDSGDWDLVVVDCAPSAETLRLLTLPEILGWHLDRLLPAQRRLLTTLRPAAAAATGIPLPDREVLDVIGTWRRLMARCREVLTGPSASGSLNGTPTSMTSAIAPAASRLDSNAALAGCPDIRKGIKALRPSSAARANAASSW